MGRVSWASDCRGEEGGSCVFSAEFGQRKNVLGREKDKGAGNKGTDGKAEAGGCRLQPDAKLGRGDG